MNLSEKYRPTSLEEIVGQDAAVKQVEALFSKKGSFPSSLMIFGGSGTGKSTFARIIAARLAGISYKGFSSIENCPDIHEENLGDKRGIDDIRRFSEQSRFKPTGGKNKVFIFDEIHNLTQASANALLKPLENPPPTTKFIALTNEPQKVLYTLKRRCIIITLAKPSAESIAKRLYKISKLEKVDIDKKVIKKIAELSRNSPAEAINMLESVLGIAREGGSSKEQLKELSNVIPIDIEKLVYAYIAACYSGEVVKVMEALHGNKIPIVDFCTRAMDVNAMITYHIHSGTSPVDPNPKSLYEYLMAKIEKGKIQNSAKQWLHTSLANLRREAMNSQSIEDNHDLLSILLRNQK